MSLMSSTGLFHSESSLQQCLYTGFYLRHISGRLKPGNDISIPVDDEFASITNLMG